MKTSDSASKPSSIKNTPQVSSPKEPTIKPSDSLLDKSLAEWVHEGIISLHNPNIPLPKVF